MSIINADVIENNKYLFYTKIDKTRMMFIKHYAPNRCLCIRWPIDHWVEDCRDVTKAGGGGICTKNGSYCEKVKKSGGGGSG